PIVALMASVASPACARSAAMPVNRTVTITTRLLSHAPPDSHCTQAPIFIMNLSLLLVSLLLVWRPGSTSAGRSFHITMDVLAHQLFEIKTGLRVADGVAGLQRIAASSWRKRQKFLADDASRLDRRNGVRIELDLIVHGQKHGGSVLVQGNRPNASDLHAGNFNR